MTSDDSSPPQDDPASLIKKSWEERARSPYREFYVASHRGWDSDDAVESQARFDAEVVLHGLSDEWLADADVLEIGSGSGRLAQQIAPRVASYSGFDIAPTMVDVATQHLTDHANARVIVGSGNGIPDELKARSYKLVYSHAVLIHCPLEIITAYVRDAWPLVAPGGQLRLQLLADPEDLTGIQSAEDAPTLRVAPPQADTSALSDDEKRHLADIEDELDGTYYMGAKFRYDDVEPALRELAPDAEMQLMRFAAEHIYVDMVKI